MAMVKKRLLITKSVENEEVVEIAHEALIREWSLLQAWLKDEHQLTMTPSTSFFGKTF